MVRISPIEVQVAINENQIGFAVYAERVTAPDDQIRSFAYFDRSCFIVDPQGTCRIRGNPAHGSALADIHAHARRGGEGFSRFLI